MILFKPERIPDILTGRKTVTRRRGKRRWSVGSIHQARTTMFGKPFARLRIVSVTAERRPGFADENPPWYPVSFSGSFWDEGNREGFASWPQFEEEFERLHGRNAMHEPCWRVEFEVVE